jgi:hypothetical protein
LTTDCDSLNACDSDFFQKKKTRRRSNLTTGSSCSQFKDEDAEMDEDFFTFCSQHPLDGDCDYFLTANDEQHLSSAVEDAEMDADFFNFCSKHPLNGNCDYLDGNMFVADNIIFPDLKNVVRMVGLTEGMTPVGEESYIFQKKEDHDHEVVGAWRRRSSCEKMLWPDQRIHQNIVVAETNTFINRRDYFPTTRKPMTTQFYYEKNSVINTSHHN